MFVCCTDARLEEIYEKVPDSKSTLTRLDNTS